MATTTREVVRVRISRSRQGCGHRRRLVVLRLREVLASVRVIVRRSHNTVLTDILRLVADDPDVPPTALATRANVPYDRLGRYVDELRRLRLVHDEAPLRLTTRGAQLLVDHERWREALHMAGLSGEPHDLP